MKNEKYQMFIKFANGTIVYSYLLYDDFTDCDKAATNIQDCLRIFGFKVSVEIKTVFVD